MAGVYKTVVTEKEIFTPELMHIRVDMIGQLRWDFLPGQYVSVDLGGLRRSYSLVNAPEQKDYLDFLIDIAPGGPGSQYFESLKVGDGFSFLGPLGRFIYESNPVEKASKQSVHFFTTGVGIAPILSMIQHELETGRSGREVYLYFGVRTPERTMVEPLLQRWAAEHSNFHYQIFVSRPPENFIPGQYHVTGRITQIIPQLTFTNGEKAYICGGKDMIDEVVDLLKLQGIPEENIHFERFY
jgi:ferredoxin-NADP reductase